MGLAAVLFFGVAARASGSVAAGLSELARAGQWRRVLEVAARRGEQLPLSPEEALVAAHAAAVLGEREAERRFLELATAVPGPELAELATVRLATTLAGDDPARSAELALPLFGRGRPTAVRAAAGDAAAGVVAARGEGALRGAIAAAAPRLPSEAARRLELALAETAGDHRWQHLERLLAGSTRDLPALAAAETLLTRAELPPRARYLAAVTLFDHGLYERAAPELEAVLGGDGVPGHEAAFQRGRCAFRRDRWQEAIDWYRRALALAPAAARRAELALHLARAHELAGDLDAAVAAAQRALREDASDERRLFLVRLRLRRGEAELATQGLVRLRSRAARGQGALLLALDALRRGDRAAAGALLAGIDRAPHAGPAAVLAAGLALESGEGGTALATLEREALSLGPYWGGEARALMARLTAAERQAWRGRRLSAAEAAEGPARWRALAQWAVLEPQGAGLDELRRRVAALTAAPDLHGGRLPHGLAGELWRLGLEREAVVWDPGSFPRSEPADARWTAARFLDQGAPWQAIRAADGAWRQLGAEMPTRALPADLRRAAFPLPEFAPVRDAATGAGIDWSLLAAVVREESRWDPRAQSAVGARGLAQLMPATAQGVAARLGRPLPGPDELFDPRTNLILAAAELGRLLELFGGRRAPAVAAYNAGEAQARLWLAQCGGASCTDGRYVAGITFAATRSYTAEVLAAAAAYAELGSDGGPETAAAPTPVSG
jgi:soluble lytic murein transglycosylase-like protein